MLIELFVEVDVRNIIDVDVKGVDNITPSSSVYLNTKYVSAVSKN